MEKDTYENIKRLQKNIYTYIVAFFVITSTRTVWLYDYSYNMNTNSMSGLVSVLLLIGIFINNKKIRIRKSEKRGIFSLVVLLIIYLLFTSGDRLLFSYMYALPLVLSILYFLSLEESRQFWRAFSNIVVVLAVISLIFFIGGTVLGIISPTRTATYKWAYTRSCPSYYDLYFEAQHLKIIGSIIQRNTGIFVEAPMYSFVLSVALGSEFFLNKKPRIKICLILIITTVTTISTTGYLMVILLVLLYYAAKTLETRKMTTRKLTLVLAIAVACAVGFTIIGEKSLTISGDASMTTRTDHVYACLKAFLYNPIIGVGYANSDAILKYANIRQGISVGLPYLLATGGVVLMLVLFIPIFCRALDVFKNRNFYFLFWKISIVFLYFFTSITSAPLFLMLNGFMYVDMSRMERKIA